MPIATASEFNQAYHSLRRSLPAVSHIISTDGVVCTADRDTAARAMARGTHRLAKPEEIEAYAAAEQAASEAIQMAEFKRTQQHAIIIQAPAAPVPAEPKSNKK